jgi:type IV pilus assembly protein PilQ
MIALAIALVAAAPLPVRRISIDIKDGDIHNVMRLLADAGHINLVIPDEVQGRITLHLADVPWDEALGIVLRTKGLGMERSGNVIQVDTEERILERTRKRAEIANARKATAPLVTILIPLSHAKAADLKPIVASMLTDRGRVEIDARTNTLIVTDVAAETGTLEQSLHGR